MRGETVHFVSEVDGLRLDRAVVGRVPNLSRAQVQRLIKAGAVTVNGRRSKPAYRVEVGDAIEVALPDEAEEAIRPEPIPLAIVHEDDDLLVVDKPAGMVVHPAFGHPSGTLVNALLWHCPDIAHVGGVERAGIVHRLDRDTSGLLVVAKNEGARRDLQRQFKRRSVDKVYLALVDGRLEPRAGIIDVPIGRDHVERKRMAVTHAGRPARTRYRVVEYFGDHALVEVRPRTGRTHQIRVHLAWMGFPLVGDSVYGRRRQTVLRDRHFLHATQLGFIHPVSKESLAFESRLPAHLERVLGRLRRRRRHQ